MQTSGLPQALPCVGSQSVPRFEFDPQTEYVPFVVVTDLQTLNLSAAAQAVGPASASHAM